ncbi:hypothetical protein CRUP_029340, partial [Coryphaenoides rupestris]
MELPKSVQSVILTSHQLAALSQLACTLLRLESGVEQLAVDAAFIVPSSRDTPCYVKDSAFSRTGLRCALLLVHNGLPLDFGWRSAFRGLAPQMAHCVRVVLEDVCTGSLQQEEAAFAAGRTLLELSPCVGHTPVTVGDQLLEDDSSHAWPETDAPRRIAKFCAVIVAQLEALLPLAVACRDGPLVEVRSSFVEACARATVAVLGRVEERALQVPRAGPPQNLPALLASSACIAQRLAHYHARLGRLWSARPLTLLPIQRFKDMAEALRDQLTSYSVQVCAGSLLHDAESHHWADPKPFYECVVMVGLGGGPLRWVSERGHGGGPLRWASEGCLGGGPLRWASEVRAPEVRAPEVRAPDVGLGGGPRGSNMVDLCSISAFPIRVRVSFLRTSWQAIHESTGRFTYIRSSMFYEERSIAAKCMSGTLVDVDVLPVGEAQGVLAQVLGETLQLLVQRYSRARPTYKRHPQIRCDITAVLLYVEQLMPSVSGSPEAQLWPLTSPAVVPGLHVVDWSSRIHHLCDQLLAVLVVATAPLALLYGNFVSESLSDSEATNPHGFMGLHWLHALHPDLYPESTLRGGPLGPGPAAACSCQLRLLTSDPGYSPRLLLRTLLQGDCHLPRTLLEHSPHYSPPFTLRHLPADIGIVIIITIIITISGSR